MTINNKRFESTRHELLHESVIDSIFQALVNGRVKPGERLVEDEITSELDVSRSPVRRALQEMARQGIVELIPRRGARVKIWSIEDVLDFWRVRVLLEAEAAELAAARINPDEVTELREITKKMCEASTSGTVEEEIEWDIKFHKQVVNSSRNETLISLYNSMELKIHMFMVYEKYISGSQRERLELTKEHIPIVEALENGDGNLSRNLMEANVSAAVEALVNRMKEAGSDEEINDFSALFEEIFREA